MDFEIPKEIEEFFLDLSLSSMIDKKGFKKYNFLLIMFVADDEGNTIRFAHSNAVSTGDKEILLGRLLKNSEDLTDQLTKGNSKYLSHPKPKQIKENYYGEYEDILSRVKVDLDHFLKVYGFNYSLLLYEGETIKTLYKIDRQIAFNHISTIEYYYGCVRAILEGLDPEDLEVLDEDFDPEDESFLKTDKEKQENNKTLDDDEKGFNEY